MGGSNTSEGVQILQYMPEVSGPPGPNTSKYLDRGGPLPGGSNFFGTGILSRLCACSVWLQCSARKKVRENSWLAV